LNCPDHGAMRCSFEFMAFHPSEPLTIGDREFSSLLLIGTDNFSSKESMKAAIFKDGDSLEIVKIVAGD